MGDDNRQNGNPDEPIPSIDPKPEPVKEPAPAPEVQDPEPGPDDPRVPKRL